LVRALLALVVLSLSGCFVLTSSPTLGLDLRGGAQIVLEAQDTDTVTADAEATDRAIEVLRRRVDALGVSEPTLTRSGDRRVIVELPGISDPEEASEAIGRTAQLTFHEVLGVEQTPPAEGDEPDPETGEQVILDEQGGPIRVGPVVMTGESVGDAEGVLDPQTARWSVTIDFVADGPDTWQQMTADAACFPSGDPQRRIAIVLDGETISSPQVNETVPCGVGITGGTTEITGNFDSESAKELAALVKGGALPVPVEVIEQRVVGPTLGQAAIDASFLATIIGLAVTAVFILYIYRLLGLIAAIALACYALIAFGTLTALGATLTLPGLAGFVLAIGMAVDANVLVFERAREDYVDGSVKSGRKAVQSGFRNALSAIADSNITTLIAAALLFFLAAGPVRGFGVTLTIGVLASMFSALVITRVLAEWAIDRGWMIRHPMTTGIGRHTRFRLWLRKVQPNLMRHSRKFLAVSALVVLVAIAGIALRGLNLGIEFTGGRQLAIDTTNPVDIDDARSAIADAGFPTAIVQESDDADVSVRTIPITDAEANTIEAAVGDVAGGAVTVRDELIGPSMGDELRRNALIALAVALAAQLAYLAIRFRWTFSTGAVVALFQNVVVVVGLFAWLGKPIDGIFLAALLTIIGYTVNDSVVVFDRIREEWRATPTGDFRAVSNSAVLNTLPRSVNTGLSTLFILMALLFLGGESLSDFALALVIGIAVGTYSSNFTATPIAVELEGRYPTPPPEPKESKRDARTREDPNYGAVV
ncbi:MAG TPA: protein translocase subunit SecD, partial [Jiangellaceae bacterium]|nr:protein translocase subunit SecD [Jiangellaceae bacterium]